MLAVVTRLQGGEERLASAGVKVTPFVAIDEDFLRIYSKDPERALVYQTDPRRWSENYLMEHGVGALVKFFDPNGGKLDRAKKFLQRYETVLKESGQIAFLEVELANNYNLRLVDLMEE